MFLGEQSDVPKEPLEFLNILAARTSTRGVPVLVLSHVEDQSLRSRSIELGAAEYLDKGISRHQLVKRIRIIPRHTCAGFATRACRLASMSPCLVRPAS